MTVVEVYFAEVSRIILSMTIIGSILSVFLLILKPMTKGRLPKSFQYYMWFSVVIALMLPISEIVVIPVSNPSILSMKSMYDITQRFVDTALDKPFNLVFAPQNENGQNMGQIAYLPSTAVILSVFWQFGMIMVLGFHILCYVSYVRKLGRYNIRAGQRETEVLNALLESKKTLKLYKNSMVKTPILIGFFRPAVILPDKAYEDMMLRNILMHEVTHWKRHDIFVKWLLIFVGAVHWFNPLVYLVRREMNKACELACDEAVIRRFDICEMQQYGDALIAVAADSIRKIPLPIAMLEDKKNLKERLGAIMEHKKFSKTTVVTAGVILVTIVCAVLGFSTLHGTENEHSYMYNFSSQDLMLLKKENELRWVIQNYDKENIDLVVVYLNCSDGGDITNAYICILGREENPNPEMLDGVKSLVSEELELDIPNIRLNYGTFPDVSAFTRRRAE